MKWISQNICGQRGAAIFTVLLPVWALTAQWLPQTFPAWAVAAIGCLLFLPVLLSKGNYYRLREGIFLLLPVKNDSFVSRRKKGVSWRSLLSVSVCFGILGGLLAAFSPLTAGSHSLYWGLWCLPGTAVLLTCSMSEREKETGLPVSEIIIPSEGRRPLYVLLTSLFLSGCMAGAAFWWGGNAESCILSFCLGMLAAGTAAAVIERVDIWCGRQVKIKLADRGIQLKNPGVLGKIRQMDTLLLARTGVVTESKTAVVGITGLGGQFPPEKVLSYAAAAEACSEHPIASAIQDRADELQVLIRQGSAYQEISGCGVRAIVDGEKVLVGSERLLREYGVEPEDFLPLAEQAGASGKTPVYVAIDGQVVGLITAAFRVCSGVRAAVSQLKECGLSLCLISGDGPVTVSSVGRYLGAEQILPEKSAGEKSEAVQELREQGRRILAVAWDAPDVASFVHADLLAVMSSSARASKDFENERRSFENIRPEKETARIAADVILPDSGSFEGEEKEIGLVSLFHLISAEEKILPWLKRARTWSLTATAGLFLFLMGLALLGRIPLS